MKRKNHHHIINHSARRSSNPKMRHRKMFKMNIDSHYDREEEKEEPVSKNRKTRISKNAPQLFLECCRGCRFALPSEWIKGYRRKKYSQINQM
jgi:hypothetical protein